MVPCFLGWSTVPGESWIQTQRYKTLEQLAYAWILAHPSIPLPVIGTNKVERLRSAANAIEIELQREDWYALWEAAHGHKIP